MKESVSPEKLELSSDENVFFQQSFDVRMQSHPLDEEVFLSGDAQGKIQLRCSRCLESFEFPVRVNWELEVDARENWANVGREIREQVLLSVPIKPLCRSDCRGLCPSCGHVLNQGPCSCSAQKSKV